MRITLRQHASAEGWRVCNEFEMQAPKEWAVQSVFGKGKPLNDNLVIVVASSELFERARQILVARAEHPSQLTMNEFGIVEDEYGSCQWNLSWHTPASAPRNKVVLGAGLFLTLFGQQGEIRSTDLSLRGTLYITWTEARKQLLARGFLVECGNRLVIGRLKAQNPTYHMTLICQIGDSVTPTIFDLITDTL